MICMIYYSGERRMKAYQVKFELFDVWEGISTEKTSDVIHRISEIYSSSMDADTKQGVLVVNRSGDVSVV